ncbi:MAG: hypothetical protein NTW78_11500 [Campylobacterales bacterium]|nr:hypothetical protein [Campylobacterales bacterium]
MSDINNGIIVNGGIMNVKTIIQKNTSNKWSKVDNWIDEHRQNIKNYELLQEQIDELKTHKKFDSEKKESIFKKVLDSVGSIADGIDLIQLIKEIF